MKEIYSIKERQCYSEVYDIINFLDEDLKKKIPQKWINFLENEKMNNYVTTINPYIPLEMQQIDKKTKIIISYLYIKYLCDDNEKKFFYDKEAKERKDEIKKSEKLEQDIFKKNDSSNNVDASDTKMMIVKKENLFVKLKKWLYKIFK